ncbi:alpha/beta hydrolase [Micromonospora sp. RP3T]|uniref:alpha/beta hydrolase n=1 Tax=Micromonospora sp. RP3T TaxID=2135446 RepID=UPI000D16B3D0|nr:alpha/beta hydrolase [Micromonospora sp. RP3T]PTA45215.1 alpha/beta hydrolase [Micromonospora sp. RP3T]
MNDVAELKRYVVLHARAQQIPPEQYRAVLDRIDHDEEGKPGSWAVEWSRSATELRERGDLLAAARHWTMARFPYVDGPARREALDNAVATFDAWRTDIEPLRVDTPRGELRCWSTRLPDRPRPLLLIMGGIVSTKEQWAPALSLVARLGMAGMVAELPGVGQNTLPYDRDSWRMIPELLDGLGPVAVGGDVYLLALSFSGHLALRAAAHDQRISGIVLAGAPVHDFFTDPDWQRRIPRVTRDTLAHLTGVEPATVATRIHDWALTDDELAAVRVPVGCVVSTRDEVIPRSDVDRLTRTLPRIRLLEHDDVHGSPDHVVESQLWSVLTVLRMRRVLPLRRAALNAALAMTRLRRRFGTA